jgi:hypothetical protein
LGRWQFPVPDSSRSKWQVDPGVRNIGTPGLRSCANLGMRVLGMGDGCRRDVVSTIRGGCTRNMGWATNHIARLQAGETVSFRPRGNSMSPRIRSGQLCTVQPVEPTTIEIGDVVLCRVRGAEYLHLVKAIDGQRLLIGNNRGHLNGWIGPNAVFGRLVRVDP